VSRPLRVRLDALDEEGRAYSVEFEDFAARVCQHEADHLDGVVFLDRMDNLSTLTFGDEYRRHWAPKEEEKKEGGEKN
ncbi:MAG: peptide deformylase, partial [bacterium]